MRRSRSSDALRAGDEKLGGRDLKIQRAKMRARVEPAPLRATARERGDVRRGNSEIEIPVPIFERGKQIGRECVLQRVRRERGVFHE